MFTPRPPTNQYETTESIIYIVNVSICWVSFPDKIDPDEVEDFLTDVLDHEFNTVADDGSLTEVPISIRVYHNFLDFSDRIGKKVAKDSRMISFRRCM